MSNLFNYEADQIHDLVHPNLLTDSTHYVAECKEIILTETIPNYPKLTDYESEWLYFYEHEYQGGGDPVNLEYQTLEFDQSATVSNAIPFKYKKASLKGQTLVNLLKTEKNSNYHMNGNYWTVEDDYFKLNPPSVEGGYQWCTIQHKNGSMLQPNSKYLLIFDVKENSCNGAYNLAFDGYDSNLTPTGQIVSFKDGETGIKKVIVTTTSTINGKKGLFRAPINLPKGGTLMFRIMAIPYQEGMENWDIPYFEGMLSVQMPVLTTSNEDGTKTNILTVNEDVTLRGIGDIQDELNLLTGELTSSLGEVVLDGTQTVTSSQRWGNYTKTRFTLIGVKDTRSGGDNAPLMSDKLKPYGYWGEDDKGEYFFTGNNYIDIVHSNEKNIVQWLKDNPTLIIYPLIESTIKTVDLNTIIKPYEGTNHFEVSSDTIPPRCILSVPIESTGTQTLMEINQED